MAMFVQTCTAGFKLEVTKMSNDCPVCGQEFGSHAWSGIGRVQHMWHVHGIPGKATFNRRIVEFNDKSGVQKTTS